MIRNHIHKIFYLFSIMLGMAFVIRCVIDFINYDATNSAPFYVFVAVDALEFILPSLLVFILARILKKNRARN